MTSACWIVDNRCAIAKVVLPRAAASRAFCTIFSDSESKADVASSSNKIFGFRISALAIAIRCF